MKCGSGGGGGDDDDNGAAIDLLPSSIIRTIQAAVTN